jgi:uncharacterized cupredoxin-like copper-binding protein
VLRAILVAAIPQSGEALGVSPAVLAALPAVTLDQFEGSERRVKAGERVAFHLENPDVVRHSFDIDELGVHGAIPNGKNSLTVF